MQMPRLRMPGGNWKKDQILWAVHNPGHPSWHGQEGHEVHAQLIQKEAAGEKTPVSLLLLHAEDQMMGAEQFKTMALEMIDLYKRLDD